MQDNSHKPLRVGIIGFGHLGQFVCEHFQSECNQIEREFDLIFIWNRSKDVFLESHQELIVPTIEEGLKRRPDLVIEVAHPDIIEAYAEKILDVCDLFIGSPTALARASLEEKLRKKTMESGGHVIYIGTGAFWGAEDIVKMDKRNTLRSLNITMKKHPDSYKLNEPLRSKLLDERDKQQEILIYSGPVRELCRLAPNNVNTMAVGAIVASHLGFDGVQGCLIADRSLTDRHIVEIELTGPKTTIGDNNQVEFHLKTTRTNPAQIGAVTGTATLLSFLSSIKCAKGQTSGIHVV